MKHKTLFVFVLALFYTSAEINAATYNTRSYRNHGEWSSFEMYLGEERSFRAVNASDYSDLFLAVDHHPSDCSDPVISARIEMDEIFPATNDGNILSADMRVDRRDMQNGLVSFSTERGDSGAYLHFMIPDKAKLLQEMLNGSTLRFRLTGEDIDPWYMEFGLKGSMAAITRAASMCNEVSEPPEEFFKENSESSDSAKDYF
ncbi:hypothetical protein ABE957_10320 [Halomonas sp. CS7]|uniref:DUF695 domain-containing protein n=1 Tax=Halomonas pelophila TaxID=3151122 RepID=A0ABV1N7H7_9GAMM